MKTEKTKKIIALALVTVLAALLLCSCGKTEETDPHEGQVYIYDGYDFVWYTPLEGVAVNELTEEKFSGSTTEPVYYGEDYTVLKGIDVSEHQYDIDWQQVAADGVDYAIIRVGRRGYTEGGLFEDPYFAANISGAKAAGLKVGVYFFSQAITVSEAMEEAQYVIDRVSAYSLDLPVFFDWEEVESDSGARTDDLDSEVLTDCAVAFCEKISRAGLQPGIYFNRTLGYYGYDLSRLTDYMFWFSLPDFAYPSFYYASEMWQYSFTADIAGVSTPTDMNLLFIKNTLTEGTGEG